MEKKIGTIVLENFVWASAVDRICVRVCMICKHACVSTCVLIQCCLHAYFFILMLPIILEMTHIFIYISNAADDISCLQHVSI